MFLSCIHNRAAQQHSITRKFSTVTANISGDVREDVLDGRNYWVVPVRMLREGVLNGSGGPVLYELNDMERYAAAWDTKPVVVNHPSTKNGSAASKRVLEKSGVGFLLNNEVNGSFQDAEAWIDQRKADRVDPRIRSAIENGIRMEVSTGLFADQRRKRGTWNGERFKAVAKNYRPDHLALLPDMVGACSLAQGCGLITANQAIPLKRMRKIQDVVNRLWKGKPLGNACSCRKQRKGESSMKKTSSTRTVRISANAKRLIDRIIGDGSGSWSEEDRPVLRKMDEAALKKIAAGRRQIEKLKSSVKSADKLANAAAARRRDKKRRRQEAEQKAQLRNARRKNRRPCDDDGDDTVQNTSVLTRIKTVDDALRIMPKPIRTMLSNGLSVYRQQRKQLVKIVMNSEGNKFSKEELMKMDDNTLNKLAAIANTSQQDDDEGANFSFFGQQGMVANRGTALEIDEEPLDMPSTFVTKNKKSEEDDE